MRDGLREKLQMLWESPVIMPFNCTVLLRLYFVEHLSVTKYTNKKSKLSGKQAFSVTSVGIQLQKTVTCVYNFKCYGYIM